MITINNNHCISNVNFLKYISLYKYIYIYIYNVKPRIICVDEMYLKGNIIIGVRQTQ
jgi:hypothetical protein